MKFYRFSQSVTDGNASMKDVLGGKGANLAEMSNLGMPVPPGFTIPTEVCNAYRKAKDKAKFMASLEPALVLYLKWLHDVSGLGYAPLVSVRSGARVSMPGMMDTVLNIGLTSENLSHWEEVLGYATAKDCRRRLYQMYGSVVCGISHSAFETQLSHVKKVNKVTFDSELSPMALNNLLERYQALFDATGMTLPNTALEQLKGAVEAVFQSWDNPRAQEYRKMHGYPEDWGTAVNVQMMVFGNMNDESATGVLFTRNPSTGVDKITGEFLVNAQGEDVVSGIRTPDPLDELHKWNPGAATELFELSRKLELHYRDMQDIEFTVQNGKLYMLQCRNGKRSAKAAFRIAVEMMDDNLISLEEAAKRVSAKQFLALSQPSVKDDSHPDAAGIAAGGSCEVGVVAYSEAAVKAFVAAGKPVIFVAKETTPDDIVAMNLSKGILTETGGMTSHAAVVARGMDKTCVVGCSDLKVNANILGSKSLPEGVWVTIDGSSGKVWAGQKEVVPGVIPVAAKQLLELLLGAGEEILKGSGVPSFMAVHDFCLEMGAWVGAVPRPEWPERLKQVRSVVPGTLYVDLTSQYDRLTESDVLLYAMRGLDFSMVREDTHKQLANALVESGIEFKAVLPKDFHVPSALPKASLMTGTLYAKTVNDLFEGAMPTKEFIDNVLGGQKAYDLLVTLMDSSEMKIPEAKKDPIFKSEVAALFEMFPA